MQILSLAGAFLILWAFIASACHKMNKEGLLYGLLNTIGGASLAVSLLEPLNLGAFILETIWTITGFFLVVRALRKS